MRRSIIILSFISITLSITAFDVLNSTGQTGHTGSPADGANMTCSMCHGTASTGTISITSVPTLANGYTAGTSYTISVTVAESGKPKFGFDCEALKSGNTNGGTMAAISGVTDVKVQTASSIANATHTGTGNSTSNSHTFSFKWTAPPGTDGTVTFYAAGLAADGNGTNTSADHTYKTSLVVPVNTAGIHENELSNINIFIFPNPASEKIAINYVLEKKETVIAQLYSISGSNAYDLFRETQNAGEQKNEVNLPQNVSSGTYLLKLSVGGKASFSRVVIR